MTRCRWPAACTGFERFCAALSRTTGEATLPVLPADGPSAGLFCLAAAVEADLWEGGRSSLGSPFFFARSTVILRPPSCEPLSSATARCASSDSTKPTKPKPRLCLVLRSRTIQASLTGPIASKCRSSAVSVASNARLRTKTADGWAAAIARPAGETRRATSMQSHSAAHTLLLLLLALLLLRLQYYDYDYDYDDYYTTTTTT
eukprot:scaffold181269_cov28-Tisochrysis_lutea.AAC.1